MNRESIVETILDRILGQSIGRREHTDAEHKFRCAVADFINLIDPSRSPRLNGDVLRALAHEFRSYATILDPQGDKVNERAYLDQLRVVVRGWVSEAILETMEVLSDDVLASMSARKVMADHLRQYDPVPDHLQQFAWPSDASH